MCFIGLRVPSCLQGAISRYHDPVHYVKALGGVLRARTTPWRTLTDGSRLLTDGGGSKAGAVGRPRLHHIEAPPKRSRKVGCSAHHHERQAPPFIFSRTSTCQVEGGCFRKQGCSHPQTVASPETERNRECHVQQMPRPEHTDVGASQGFRMLKQGKSCGAESMQHNARPQHALLLNAKRPCPHGAY